MDFHKRTGIGSLFAPTGAAVVLCALMSAMSAAAGTIWDGGGANASWGTANNWNPNGLPLFDSMVLGDPTGVAAYTGLWNIAGSNSLNITGDIGEAGGSRGIIKTGSGTVILSWTNTFSGDLTLNAGVVSISSSANLGAASGSLTFGRGKLQVTQDVTSLLAINTSGAGNTALFSVGLGKILQDARALDGNGDLVRFNSGTGIKTWTGRDADSNTSTPGNWRGAALVANDDLAFAENRSLTPNQVVALAVNSLSIDSGADRVVNLEGSKATATWGDGNVTLSNGSITGTGTGILTASTYAIQSGPASPILDGTGSTMTKTTGGTYALTAISTWDGAGVNGKWKTDANWAGTPPVANDSLFFDGSLWLTTNNNNFAADTNFSGITFNSGAGAFTLSGTRITLGGDVTNSSTNLQTINLAMILSADRTFTTLAGGGDLTIGGVLSETGGAQGIIKAGAGTLTLSGANTYTGATTISAGVLNIQNNTALGTTGAGTTVSDGATLQLQGGITVGPEALNITGTGAGGQTGALVNVSGTNNYGGLLTLAGATTLSSNSGMLNLTSAGTITGATFGLTLTGAGNGSISSIIGTTSGSLTKTGTGTWTLSGANTFTGATTVSAGTLILASGSGSALGSTSGITVNSGGTLLLGASNQINNTATITLGGGTFAKGNFSEGSTSTAGVGALILSATGSHLDFGTGTVGVLTFASFGPGGNALTIDNWTGTLATVGNALTDRLIFASDQSGNLSGFNFTGFGPGAVEFDLGNGYFEITPVPEVGTYFSGSIVLALILLHHRKQLRQLVHRWRASRKLRLSAAYGTGVAS
jgi:fibronectin-binding autotransporter adhesin